MYLLDDLDLTVEPGGATLDQRDVSGKAHFVDMAAGVEIVESVEDEAEALEPVDIELGVFDVGVVRLDVDVGVKLSGRLFRNLREQDEVSARAKWAQRDSLRPTYQGLGLFDVLVPEEELAVEIGKVDGVQVYDVNVAESGEHEVLEQLAADAASADHENARL